MIEWVCVTRIERSPTECPAGRWLHLEDIVSLVINRDHVVASIGSTVGLVLQTALLGVQLHLWAECITSQYAFKAQQHLVLPITLPCSMFSASRERFYACVRQLRNNFLKKRNTAVKIKYKVSKCFQ